MISDDRHKAAVFIMKCVHDHAPILHCHDDPARGLLRVPERHDFCRRRLPWITALPGGGKRPLRAQGVVRAGRVEDKSIHESAFLAVVPQDFPLKVGVSLGGAHTARR
jgi:hypothetical protein